MLLFDSIIILGNLIYRKTFTHSNKATVGTFFSIRYPKHALMSFAVFVSKIDWSHSESLRNLFAPFNYLGKA
jgi:hypothetical protein